MKIDPEYLLRSPLPDIVIAALHYVDVEDVREQRAAAIAEYENNVEDDA